MNRSSKPLMFATVLCVLLLAPSPALAQNMDDAAAGGILASLWCCWGVALLVSLAITVFNIWMLVDSIGRQDWEYPSDNKTLWVVLLVAGLFFGFGWIVALIYYFTIFKKVPRGSVAPPSTGTYPPPSGPPMPPTAPPTAPPAPPGPPSMHEEPPPQVPRPLLEESPAVPQTPPAPLVPEELVAAEPAEPAQPDAESPRDEPGDDEPPPP